MQVNVYHPIGYNDFVSVQLLKTAQTRQLSILAETRSEELQVKEAFQLNLEPPFAENLSLCLTIGSVLGNTEHWDRLLLIYFGVDQVTNPARGMGQWPGGGHRMWMAHVPGACQRQSHSKHLKCKQNRASLSSCDPAHAGKCYVSKAANSELGMSSWVKQQHNLEVSDPPIIYGITNFPFCVAFASSTCYFAR